MKLTNKLLKEAENEKNLVERKCGLSDLSKKLL